MKFLCYRGVVYQRIQAAIELVRVERAPVVPASVRVLCYRGVFYLRETQPAPYLEPVPLQPSDQIPLAQKAMQSKQVGSLYKLYCVGWRNGSLKQFSQLQHWLLSLFFYYRLGFAEASEWKEDQLR